MKTSRMKSVTEESSLIIELTVCRSDVDCLVEQTSLLAPLLVRKLRGTWTSSPQSNFIKSKALRSSFLYLLLVRKVAYTCDIDWYP
jgi:hypothetical protein